MNSKQQTVVVLDNIRSTHNVGSIFRTADAAGVSKVYLCGYTPSPVDRFGREQKDVAKTALGAQKSVPWEQGSATDVITQLRAEGFEICAVEQDARAKNIYDYAPPKKLALVFGNEVEGVQQHLLDTSDAIVEIPMRGEKESLNVSVSVGVALFCIRPSS